MNSKIITRAACLAELTSSPKSFLNCPDLHGDVPDLPRGSRPEGMVASIGQASVEFVHANNPIPKVSGNRISRFRELVAPQRAVRLVTFGPMPRRRPSNW